ncbi:hypothetical protein EVAR_9689_1 [Eumeta japonica]|uniref:Uncharacterized protein n=1 Tax=Eumeta variegata TaxID=151549 RepID=A0A4C1YC38_EUMVA|nr:hypothetical protein EVAR_9689_1 [Eumeta japonica]
MMECDLFLVMRAVFGRGRRRPARCPGAGAAPSVSAPLPGPARRCCIDNYSSLMYMVFGLRRDLPATYSECCVHGGVRCRPAACWMQSGRAARRRAASSPTAGRLLRTNTVNGVMNSSSDFYVV